MLTAFWKFIGYSLIVTCAGFATLLISLAFLPESRTPSGPLLIPFAIAALLIYGSPLLVGFWFWRKSGRAKMLRQHEEAARNREAAESKALKRRLDERGRLISAIENHRGALIRNLERAIRKNDYGAVT